MEKFYIKWPITAKCPLNCTFCNNKAKRSKWPNELLSKEVTEFINFVNNTTAISGITISGGEPTSSPNFVEVCTHLKKPFGFITSGYNIFSSQFNAIFENKNLNFITLSIDCLDPGKVGEIRGKSILEDQLKSLNYLLDQRKKNDTPNFKIFVNTVVTKMNYNEILKLVDTLAHLGIDRLQLFRCASTNSIEIDKQLQLSFEEELDISKQLIDFFIENEQTWLEKNFTLLMRFLPTSGIHYWEKRYDRSLPFKSTTCSIKRNTLHLKTDTTLNLCSFYKHNNVYRNIQNTKISKINFEYFVSNIILPSKDKVSNFNDYNNFYPCTQCDLLLKKCNPCIAFATNSDKYNNTKEIRMSSCMQYMKLLNNID